MTSFSSLNPKTRSPLPLHNGVLKAFGLFILLLPLLWYIHRHKHQFSVGAPLSSRRSRLPDPVSGSLPPFCKALLKEPREGKGCKRDPDTMGCKDGSFAMFSQYNQDFYVYTRHFQYLKRPGVYLDVATNDPTKISNTYFMDACLRWRGVCVEANPRYHEAIRSKRSCQLVPTCVGERDGELVSFALSGGLSGIADTNKNLEKWGRKNVTKEEISLSCRRVGSVLAEYGVTKVDYLSLDIEGHELSMLHGVDWDHVEIDVITVEVNKKTLQGIQEFLEGLGYVRHVPELSQQTMDTGKLWEDAVFLRNGVQFGKPV